MNYITVSSLAVSLSGCEADEIINRWQVASKGYDGSFTLKDNLFAVDRQRIADTIIFLGKVPIEWYEEDLKRERIQKEMYEAKKREQERLWSRRPEGTKTERRREKISSEYWSRNCK